MRPGTIGHLPTLVSIGPTGGVRCPFVAGASSGIRQCDAERAGGLYPIAQSPVRGLRSTAPLHDSEAYRSPVRWTSFLDASPCRSLRTRASSRHLIRVTAPSRHPVKSANPGAVIPYTL